MQEGLFVRARRALLALLFVAGGTHAMPVTWTLQNVTFDDGGTASGWFVYDADTPQAPTIEFSISVSGGNTQIFPPITYDSSNASMYVGEGGTGDAGTVFSLNDASLRQIRIPAVSPLTDAGGTLAVNIAGRGAAECYNCGPFRAYTGGNLVGTAAPAITSAAQATFKIGAPVAFTVTSTGVPTPALSVSGALPQGVSFTDNGDGTGTFSGSSTVLGSAILTITASNGAQPDATQAFTLSFVAPTPPVNAPTLGGFGLLACMLALMAAAMWRASTERRARQR